MNPSDRTSAGEMQWLPLADGGGVVQRPAEAAGAGRSAGPKTPASAPIDAPLEQSSDSPYRSPEEHPDSVPGEEERTSEEVPPQREDSIEQ